MIDEPETSEDCFFEAVDYVRYAESAERAGDNLSAAELFERAAKLFEGATEGTDGNWLNQAAINYRLAGSAYWLKALELFDYVIEHAGGELSARARRDKAMLLVELGRFDEALELLELAAHYYRKYDQTVERAVTEGFIGRLYLAWNEPGVASLYLYDADRDLRGRHDLYELNNLIWFMKAVGPVRRPLLLLRALRLAAATGYRRRAVEAGLITISPALYDAVHDRVRHRRI